MGERLKDVETIAALPNLTDLTISGQSLKSLAFLAEAPALEALSLAFGGIRALDAIPSLPHLAHLSIWRTRMLEEVHLHPIGEAVGLRSLRLIELPRVRSLDWLQHDGIETLELDLANLSSYSTLHGLTGLRTLVVRAEVGAHALTDLATLPSLRTLWLCAHCIEQLPQQTLSTFAASLYPITFLPGEAPPSLTS